MAFDLVSQGKANQQRPQTAGDAMQRKELVLKALKDGGVKDIFGYTGDGKMVETARSGFTVLEK